MPTVEKVSQLTQVVALMPDPIPILIAQVDPDALGCAFGLQALVRMMARDSTILYAGSFSNPQNRVIFNVYDLGRKVHPIETLAANEGLLCALVDSSSATDSRLERLGKINPLIVIDHHQSSDVLESNGKYIQIEPVGAASTLMIELLQEAQFDFSKDSGLAAMLAIGVYSDTKELRGASRRDRIAFTFIREFANDADFALLVNYSLPPSFFTHRALAMQNMRQEGSVIVTHIGKIGSIEGDDLSSIADELIRMTGISLVLVWGIFDNLVVRVSARSTDMTLPLVTFLKDCFGQRAGAKVTPDGRGEGGALITIRQEWPHDSGGIAPETIDLIQRRIEHSVFKK